MLNMMDGLPLFMYSYKNVLIQDNAFISIRKSRFLKLTLFSLRIYLPIFYDSEDYQSMVP
jgi:hypothetical protein